ncbi:MAG: hypothetical protein HYY58_01065 [Candidatus Omnitrophica bacterium]|nr:hypothetical protein [Candidatus Omnitrophota bacterium]
MRTSKGRAGLLVAVAAAWCLGGWPASAEDRAGERVDMVLKTKEGLHFKVPPDWPVEKRDGVVAPIPIEEYMFRKFSAMESRLRALEQQVGAMELRIRVLEEELNKQQGLRSGGASP